MAKIKNISNDMNNKDSVLYRNLKILFLTELDNTILQINA